jgi:O-acetyl-ADP-ribose deacetylase (regulator of RNase III)
VKRDGSVKTGTCAYTRGGQLKCKYVIHAVGPIWNDHIPKEKNVQLLYSAVVNSLAMANRLKCKSIAMPAISSGIYGFPKPLCAKTFFQAIEDFCKKMEDETLILE